ncbi:MAG: transglycosylase domain-containing protein [Bacteroidia bacterium]|nr:transglycosylase domain-containing protein [Bacteroidia bacterium]
MRRLLWAASQMILIFLGVGVGLVWMLRWAPFPPVGVVLGYFSGKAPQWGWLGSLDGLPHLRKAIQVLETEPRLRRRPPLAQRVAEQVFYPPEAKKWGSFFLSKLLELLWNEERLILFYINSIPYDTDVYGIQAAAQRHFRKSIEQLSSGQLAELLLRREGPPLSVPLPASLHKERQRLERLLLTAYGS